MSYQSASNFIEKMGYTAETDLKTIQANHTPEDSESIIAIFFNQPEFITVNGFFGDKKVTEEEFVQEWIDHCNQMRRINNKLDWHKMVSEFVQSVEEQARTEFRTIYATSKASEE